MQDAGPAAVSSSSAASATGEADGGAGGEGRGIMDLCDVAALLQLLGNLALLDGAVNYEPWTAPSPTRCSPC